MGFGRHSDTHSYAFLVAQFTAFIVLLEEAPQHATPALLRELAFLRIEQNLIGMGVFTGIELVLFPKRATDALHRQVALNLRHAAAEVGAVWDGMLRPPGAAAAGAPAPGPAGALLDSGVARQRLLIAESASEPHWRVPQVSPRPPARISRTSPSPLTVTPHDPAGSWAGASPRRSTPPSPSSSRMSLCSSR